MVDGARVDGVGDGRGGGRHKAVDDHRDMLLPCSDQGSEHCRDLATAKMSKDRKRINETLMMEIQRRIDRGSLPAETLIIDAGSAAHPVGAIAAVKGSIKSGGDGGVADA